MSIQDFKFRLKKIIGDGRNVSSFAKKCGFTEGVLRSYLAGKSLPGMDKLVRIAEIANVSIEWLAIGEDKLKEVGKVVETPPLYKGKPTVADRINQHLEQMDEEAQRDVLKYTEKTKCYAKVMAEKKNRKAG